MLSKDDVAGKLALVEAKTKRWTTRAKRAATALAKLDKDRRRLQKQLQKMPAPVAATTPDTLDIPDYLLRDEAAKAKLLAELEETKRKKSKLAAERRQVKKEHRDALLTGALRKMPLTGKAALAAIRGE